MERTVDQILQQIHREYEGDVDYLEFDDEETQLRVAYIKDSIREWINKFPEHREVFTSLSDAADGDTTTSNGVSIYDCPSNFVRPTNLVKIGSTYLSYIAPEEIAIKNQENSAQEWFTITGSPGAYKLRINPTPTGASTIEYDYWKSIAVPATTTDVVEISRPMFCVYYTLNKIYKEDDAVQEEKYKKLMEEEERLERVALAKTPGEPNRLIVGGAGFGDRSSTVSNILTGN
jgi:hypothetical protein